MKHHASAPRRGDASQPLRVGFDKEAAQEVGHVPLPLSQSAAGDRSRSRISRSNSDCSRRSARIYSSKVGGPGSLGSNGHSPRALRARVSSMTSHSASVRCGYSRRSSSVGMVCSLQAPAPPSFGRRWRGGRMSLTAIRPRTRPPITTGMDCPSLKNSGGP